MTHDDAAELVAVLDAAYAGHGNAMNQATFRFYTAELELLSDPQILRLAVQDLITNPEVKFLPRIGEIIGAYEDRARIVREQRDTEERIRASRFSDSHGLPPAGDWKDANPIPAETVTFLQRKWGIDVTHLIKHINDAA